MESNRKSAFQCWLSMEAHGKNIHFPLTRLTTSNVLSVQQTKNVSASKTVITKKLSNNSQKPLTSYQRRNKQYKAVPTSIPTPTMNQEIHMSMPTDVVQIVLWYLDSGYSKHMTRDHSRLRNFVKKFIGTVRFRNDYFGAIMGYGNYVIGDNVISRVYYVEGLGHNLFSVGQFCDSDLEVAFRKHSSEAVATACFTQNRSLIHTRHNKTTYELVHDKKPDLTFLRVFGALCYPTNDNEDLGKLQPTADIRIFVGYAPSRKEPPRVDRPISLAVAVQVPVISADTPSSTTIDQDAPFPSHSPSSLELQPHVSHQGVAARSTLIEENPSAHADNDPFVNLFALKPSSKASSSEDVCSAEYTHVTQPHHHLGK
ncbi:retrovirus-related pol polyprotein from transposon TNT 1-94 [Tanacetum coccineum]